MTLHLVHKINSRLRFLHRNNRYLTQSLRRLLCNSLIQPHLDYASLCWFPNLTEKFKKKVQVAQNKCVRFCLHLDNRSHIGLTHLREINWLIQKIDSNRHYVLLSLNFFQTNLLHLCQKYSMPLIKVI